jgi:transcriptional regulator with XRE-family HTH domain
MRKLPHPLKNVVGPAIQRRRTELGWSQAKLATECQLVGWDVSRSIIAAIEGRVRWAGDYEVALLARILRVSIEALYPQNVDWAVLGHAQINISRRSKR